MIKNIIKFLILIKKKEGDTYFPPCTFDTWLVSEFIKIIDFRPMNNFGDLTLEYTNNHPSLFRPSTRWIVSKTENELIGRLCCILWGLREVHS